MEAVEKKLSRLSMAGENEAECSQSPDKENDDFQGQSSKTDISNISKETKQRFNNLLKKAKQHYDQYHIEKALKLYKKAREVVPTAQVTKRIERLEDLLAKRITLEDGFVQDDVASLYVLDDMFFLPSQVYHNLLTHQREGVRWFWDLYKNGNGGILGDDMGLGKTIQVVTFLDGLISSELASCVLIVMPFSLLTNWEREFKKWAPDVTVKVFHGTSKKQRLAMLKQMHESGGVVLTTYGMVTTSAEELNGDAEFAWDCIVCDEGHRLKNPSIKMSTSIRKIRASHRFLLTGTPIQNSLDEMWALFDYVCDGALLGTSRTFKMSYTNPIVAGSDRHATEDEKKLGQKLAQSLRELIAPYFLRRDKATVLTSLGGHALPEADEPSAAASDDETDGAAAGPPPPSLAQKFSLPPKNDLIVWTFLSPAQQRVYDQFLNSSLVATLLNTTQSVLAALTVLKKLCDHPRLLLRTVAYREALGIVPDAAETPASSLDGDLDKVTDDIGAYSQADADVRNVLCDARALADTPLDELIAQSGKLEFLQLLLRNLKAEGHRVLLFSQSLKMLDIIGRVLDAQGMSHLRIDGTISKAAERQKLIDRFNDDPTQFCFMLTTQVGGLGITLTSADRVIIFDPSWNPSVDAQAVDRAYRIGQTKPVVVYRLVTCGTIEEKIYRKQGGLMRTATSSKDTFRYFTSQELRELFTLDDPTCSATQQQLSEVHANQRNTNPQLEAHIRFVESLGVFGISDHDLLFSLKAEGHAGAADDESVAERVRTAQAGIARENEARTPAVHKKDRRAHTAADDVLGRTPGPQRLQESAPQTPSSPLVVHASSPPIAAVPFNVDEPEHDEEIVAASPAPSSPAEPSRGVLMNDPIVILDSPASAQPSPCAEPSTPPFREITAMEPECGAEQVLLSANDSFATPRSSHSGREMDAEDGADGDGGAEEAAEGEVGEGEGATSAEPSDGEDLGEADTEEDEDEDDDTAGSLDEMIDDGEIESSNDDSTHQEAEEDEEAVQVEDANREDAPMECDGCEHGDDEACEAPTAVQETTPTHVGLNLTPERDAAVPESEQPKSIAPGSVPAIPAPPFVVNGESFDSPVAYVMSPAGFVSTRRRRRSKFVPDFDQFQSCPVPHVGSVDCPAEPARETVCAEHSSEVVAVKKCICVCDDKAAYNALLTSAKNHELQGDDQAALRDTLSALKLCSSDLSVHRQALVVANRLGLFPVDGTAQRLEL